MYIKIPDGEGHEQYLRTLEETLKYYAVPYELIEDKDIVSNDIQAVNQPSLGKATRGRGKLSLNS